MACKENGTEVICYTGGISGSNDILYARQIAKKLDLKLRVNELSQDEVEQMIPEVINTIEDTNAGQVEVAIPVYAVKLAHEDGINVMFAARVQMSYLEVIHGMQE